jgi:hypothetical protein
VRATAPSRAKSRWAVNVEFIACSGLHAHFGNTLSYANTVFGIVAGAL